MNKNFNEIKQCSICKRLLPLSEFYIRSDRKKPISRCKKCNTIASKISRSKKSKKQIQKEYRKRAEYYKEQARKGNLKAIIQHKLSGYRGIAKKKNVPFDITVDYLIELFKKQKGFCYYTNKKMTVATRKGKGHRTTLFTDPNHFSLNRLEPKKGYAKGNLVWCTWQINTTKNQFTEEQFYRHCKKILEMKNKREKENKNIQ